MTDQMSIDQTRSKSLDKDEIHRLVLDFIDLEDTGDVEVLINKYLSTVALASEITGKEFWELVFLSKLPINMRMRWRSLNYLDKEAKLRILILEDKIKMDQDARAKEISKVNRSKRKKKTGPVNKRFRKQKVAMHGSRKCFKCCALGHTARNCTKKKGK